MINDLVVLIVDDEPKVAEVLKTIIENKIDIEEKISVSCVHCVKDAVKFIDSYLPDLVFLDIHMPQENGLELLKQVDSSSFEVVFTTAYDKYAIQAINEHDCLKYLLKPLSISDVQSVFDKYKEKLGYQYYYKIVKNNSKRHLIRIDDVVFCKAADNYCEIYLVDSKHLVSRTLKAVASRILHKNFRRVNRSYFVNMDYVKHIDRENRIEFKSALTQNNIEEEHHVIVAQNAMKDLSKWML
ncbi:LytR/AlgR family response regulator transcription factor [Myroides sp. LJL119]